MFQTFAGSWPIAVMFIAFLAFLIANRVFNYTKARDERNEAYRASQAVTVRQRNSEEG